MKRMLLVLAAVLFLNALAVPNVARADNPGGPPPTCQPGQQPPSRCPPGTLCKP